MENKFYKMNEELHQAMIYNSPTKSEEIITRYSRLWWDNVAHKCHNCKYFDGYDSCHNKGTFGAVVDETLFNCGNYTKEEINENLQKIEDIVIKEFPEYFNNFSDKTTEFGYHTKHIEKGELGEFSKIREEFEELEDAVNQEDKIMILCECSDLIGAIKHFVIKYNISLNDLISFNNKTEMAFKNGKR